MGTVHMMGQGQDLGAVSILIVDDNLHMRNLLKSVLRALGCRVIKEAADGSEAFEVMNDGFEPDIMITDHRMAVIDGLELVRAVRGGADGSNRYLPIIMCTGYAQHAKVLEARDCGVTEFLVKPITAKTLHSRLASVINNPRLFVETRSYFGPDRRRRGDGEYKGSERREREVKVA